MKKALNISIEEENINFIKKYAKSKNQSVSYVIDRMIILLQAKEGNIKETESDLD